MATATATVTKLLGIRRSPSTSRWSDRNTAGGVAYMFQTTSSRRSLKVASSRSQNDESNPDTKDPADFFNSQEDDIKYVLKLGGGSVLGAVAIKYGSVLFPEITRPNILQALLMISTPVILSLFLLINKSIPQD